MKKKTATKSPETERRLEGLRKKYREIDQRRRTQLRIKHDMELRIARLSSDLRDAQAEYTRSGTEAHQLETALNRIEVIMQKLRYRKA